MTTEFDLNIAEIPYDSGAVRYRYARFLSQDGKRWIRHGRFIEYNDDGSIKSEGCYANGFEEGLWRDFHPNGQLAAEGQYLNGKEHGIWRFWNAEGREESSTEFN